MIEVLTLPAITKPTMDWMPRGNDKNTSPEKMAKIDRQHIFSIESDGVETVFAGQQYR